MVCSLWYRLSCLPPVHYDLSYSWIFKVSVLYGSVYPLCYLFIMMSLIFGSLWCLSFMVSSILYSARSICYLPFLGLFWYLSLILSELCKISASVWSKWAHLAHFQPFFKERRLLRLAVCFPIKSSWIANKSPPEKGSSPKKKNMLLGSKFFWFLQMQILLIR